MRGSGFVILVVYLTIFVTLIAVLLAGTVIGIGWGTMEAFDWITGHLLQILLGSMATAVVGGAILGRPQARRAALARIQAAAVDIQAAQERVARGQLESAEALARKVLLAAGTNEERAVALLTLADVEEVRGEFAREEEMLAEAWDLWPKLVEGIAEVERMIAAKRAFALAAVGRVDDAERVMPPPREGAVTANELRARACLLARREAWADVEKLLAPVDVGALVGAGPRSKLLLLVLRARAQGKLADAAGGVYRAAAAPDDTADPEMRGWVGKVMGTLGTRGG